MSTNSHKSKSSRVWLQEHFSDHYVKQAQKEGYRSRAAFKLLELHKQDRLFRKGMKVVDLGAAPGGWSEVAAKLVGDEGRVIALDILPMAAIPGVQFIQGDFSSDEVYERLLQELQGISIDLVLCDMAPNISGMTAIDQPRVYYLAELAFAFVQQALKYDGVFLVKVFQGEGFESYLKGLRKAFKTVKIRKPKSSRARSNELYLLAQGYNLEPV